VSTIGDIAAGLKANLDVIDGIHVSKYPRSNPVGTLIHLWPSEIPAYHEAMRRGLTTIVFTVQVIFPYNDDGGTASQLYAYLDPTGPKSVSAAIEADPTLGGVVDDTVCESTTGLAVTLTPDNQPRLTADFRVIVLYNGSS
jgi:hypothetical protein